LRGGRGYVPVRRMKGAFGRISPAVRTVRDLCPLHGVPEWRLPGAHCDGPEWETIYAFGSQCGVDKLDAVVAANQICDEEGIDTMSAGISIGLQWSVFEKGLIGLKRQTVLNCVLATIKP